MPTEAAAPASSPTVNGQVAPAQRLAALAPIPTLLLFVAGLALILRVLLLLLFPFDGLYGQDAFFYLTATRDLVAIWINPGRLWQWLSAQGTPCLLISQ